MMNLIAELDYIEDRTRRTNGLSDMYAGYLQAENYDRDNCHEDDEIDFLVKADRPSMFANQW